MARHTLMRCVVCGDAEFVGEARGVGAVGLLGQGVLHRRDKQAGCEFVCALLVAWHTPWWVAVVGVSKFCGQVRRVFRCRSCRGVWIRRWRAVSTPLWPAAVPSDSVASGFGYVDECVEANRQGFHLVQCFYLS